MAPTQKVYSGDRTIDGVKVCVDGAELAGTSESHFEWGYEGTGPLQLAKAILTSHLGDIQKAEALAPRFMQDVVANFANEWEVTSQDIDLVLGLDST